MNKKKELGSLIIGYLGSILGLFGVICFNQYDVLMSLPLRVRMISMIAVYWLIALIPSIVVFVNKEKLLPYIFDRNQIVKQIVLGVLIGLTISVVFTLIPHLFGFGEYVSRGNNYQYLWQFIYDFFYFIFAVGFVEEFVFRGFVYEKIKVISQNTITAIIISSVAFGIFHIFNGSIIQAVMTSFLGIIFCLFKLKIKNCTVLSLAIAHGVYDALITVWGFAMPCFIYKE